MRSRLLGLVAALCLLTTVSATALPGLGRPASTFAPVKCATSDVTVDDRVFPEPRLSGTLIGFPEFECGIQLLDETFPGLVDIEVLATSAGGNPVYDVRITNEEIAESEKQHMLVLSSIHGNEEAGREGGARVIEDMVDPRFLNGEDWMQQVLDGFVTHIVFPNPDGWMAGDVVNNQGFNEARTNDGGRDLNRHFPVSGFLRASNGTLDQPEGIGVNELLLRYADTQHDLDDPNYRGWSYGTDNHGQSAKPVAASGLQIVGEFDYEKSERLAHFADGIEGAMAEYDILEQLQVLNGLTGGAVRPYEWGTLYDILGYSASGSGIDYYNTPDVINGTGFATEITAAHANTPNSLTYVGLIDQMWVDSVRSINYTMFRDAIAPPTFTFPVGGRAAYVFDPARVANNDANGMGLGNAPENIPSNFTGDQDPASFRPYNVSRMKFFSDLNLYASQDLDKITVEDVLSGATDLSVYDSVVLNESVMPTGGQENYGAWVAALTAFANGGGNLIVTDAAAPILADLYADIEPANITMTKANVGYADFVGESHLNENLRGVASQTYDVIPIGMRDGGGDAPNWRVTQSVWDTAGGVTAGTNGSGQTVYGERPLGAGKVSFLGALLPQPSEEFFHPYGLQNYAVTYTGYTLLENMLDYQRP